MGTLDSLAADIATNVWLDSDFFAEDVTFWKRGKNANAQSLKATVQEHAMEGTNEAQGDGRTLVETRGEADRKSFLIELPTTANVSEPQNQKYPDKLKRAKDGMVLVAVRTVSVDSATKRVLFVNKTTVTTRETRRQQ